MTTKVNIENIGPKKIKIIRVDNAGLVDTPLGELAVGQILETYLWDVNTIEIKEIQ